jgi:dual specificity protein kinase YAK1
LCLVEQNLFECFIHFLKGILKWNHKERWTPEMAMQHPFISQTPFSPDFEPVPEQVKQKEKKSCV